MLQNFSYFLQLILAVNILYLERSSFLSDDIIRTFSFSSQGYFGKGILSRSRPVYSISDPLLVTKWQGKLCPFVLPSLF